MSVTDRSTSRDTALEEAFGASVGELYAQAAHSESGAALHRALELRSFLALAEEQVVRVRDRVRTSMSAGRDLGELSAEDLRMDAQWLEAALAGRNGYVAALDDLLRTMPAPGQRPTRPVQFAQPKITVIAPPVPGAGAVRTRRS
uniref:Uncharacterized protein n=1 Tax=Streptomyces sp. NBC_00093 TaxID=2975649 RepID=A0AAU2ABE9_9ACTN